MKISPDQLNDPTANRRLEQLPVNQVLTALKEAGVQAGRTSVADVLQERKLFREKTLV